MKLKNFYCNSVLALIYLLFMAQISIAQPSPYLIKPDGDYSVSVRKYQLLNRNICPDNFYRISDNLFYKSANNLNHCHMLNAYVFYPTTSKSTDYLIYDNDAILQVKEDIKTNKISVNKQQYAENYINALQNIKSYVLPNKQIAKGKFPLIMFEPGWSFNSNNYQNFIANLVSHGYIVIAIDPAYSSTISESFGYLYRSDIQRVNGHPTKEFMYNMLDSKNSSLSAMKSDYSLLLADLSTPQMKWLSDHIDFDKLGAMGHSLGAMALYELSIDKNEHLKAFVSLDFGQSGDKPQHIYKPVIPSLIFRSAYDETYGIKMNASNKFYLNNDSYLVKMTPKSLDSDYSRHSSFSDFKTLVNNTSLWQLRMLTYGDINKPWYDSGTSYDAAKQSLGSGNGIEFSETINQYVVNFFDSKLKGKQIKNFVECKTFKKNSQLYCGPKVIN